MDISKDLVYLLNNIKDTPRKITMKESPKYPTNGKVIEYNFNLDNIMNKVEAIQWTGDNWTECHHFVGDIDPESFIFLRDQTLVYEFDKGTGIQEIHPYDYIVKLKNLDRCIVLNDEAFKAMFGMYNNFSIMQEESNSPDSIADNRVDIDYKDNYGNRVVLQTFDKPTANKGLLVNYEFNSCAGDYLGYDCNKDRVERLKCSDRYGNSVAISIGPYESNRKYSKKEMYENIKHFLAKSNDIIKKNNQIVQNLADKSKNMINI